MQKLVFGSSFAVAALVMLGSAAPARAQCAFNEPTKATAYTVGFVGAYVSCGNPGGNPANTTTEGGIPGCGSPETFNQQAGSPSTGWLWGPKSQASLRLKAAKNKVINPANPVGNTSDMTISLKVSGVRDGLGAASGPGAIETLTRWTLEDRVSGDMTVIDFPQRAAFFLSGGKATLKTSYNVSLNNTFGHPGFPACTAIEVISASLYDPNGTRFGVPGLVLPH